MEGPGRGEGRGRSTDALRAVELLLLWEGSVRNERLREVLGVHFTRASRVMAEYARSCPTTVAYDTAGKRFVARPGFGPILTQGRVEEYLALLQSLPGEASAGWLVRTQVDFGQTSPQVFATLQRAAREGLAVQVVHRSMRHPEPNSKTLYPHALVQAGRRWHVRAYVAQSQSFQDLALTRLSEVTLHDAVRPSAADPTQDEAWVTFVTLRIVPHPALTEAQRKIVRDEYFPGASARRMDVRAALLPYVVQDLRAAIDPQRHGPPDYQLAVDRAHTLERWLLPTVASR